MARLTLPPAHFQPRTAKVSPLSSVPRVRPVSRVGRGPAGVRGSPGRRNVGALRQNGNKTLEASRVLKQRLLGFRLGRLDQATEAVGGRRSNALRTEKTVQVLVGTVTASATPTKPFAA
jgi:hypothetical protein